MSKLSKTTKDRLRIMAGVIAENYKNFDMRHWAKTNCVTTGCIAGLAVIEFEKKVWSSYEAALKAYAKKGERLFEGPGWVMCGPFIRERATDLLGLTAGEASCIFYHSYWPKQFHDPFIAAMGNQKKQAKVAARYLRAIAKGKVNLQPSYGYQAEMVSAQ